MTRKIRNFISIVLVISFLMSCNINVYAVSENADTKIENKIGSGLAEKVLTINTEEEIPVIVWFNDIDLESAQNKAQDAVKLDVLKYTESRNYNITGKVVNKKDSLPISIPQEYVSVKRSESKKLYESYNASNAQKYFDEKDIIYQSKYSPVIIANLTLMDIQTLSNYNSIQFLDLYQETEECSIALTVDNIRASNVHYNPIYGYTGKGVKIGVYEINLPRESFIEANTEINIADTEGAIGEKSYHCEIVLQTVAAVAPDATFYIATDTILDNQTNMASIEWLIDREVNIITASITVGEDNLNTYGTMAKWLDHIAFYHDIHFVICAGNHQIDEQTGFEYNGIIPGGMSYNAITVGNLDDKANILYEDDEINLDSLYYSGSTWASKPDICAPGTNVEFIGYSSSFTGTSISTPLVAGTIALLCEQHPELLEKQDIVKAILTASVNFESPHAYVPNNRSENTDSYMQYGAGLLDAMGACWVTSYYRYVGSSISASTSVKTHTFTVSSTDDRIRVSLAYLKRSYYSSDNYHTTTNPSVAGLANLDIEIYPPNSSTPIAVSNTTFNNVEIVDFEPTVTGTYTIKIIQTSPATNGSTSYTTYYGLAWR